MDLENFYDGYWRTKADEADSYRLGLVVEKVGQGGRVLEMGGQVGHLAIRLQEKGLDVTMTALSRVALERARERGIKQALQLDFDEQSLPFDDASFDTVVSSSSIEHLFFPERMVSEGARVLKPGGRFVLLAPNIGHWRFRLWLLMGRFPVIENTPTDELHIRHLTLYEAKKMCARHGLRPVETDGNPCLWHRRLLPGFVRAKLVRFVYRKLARIHPSLFARDFLLVCRKT